MNRIKRSIARRITLSVSLVLLVALSVLFVGAYFLVSQIVTLKNHQYSESIVAIYADLAADYAEQNQAPLRPDGNNDTVRLGKYVCTWLGVDYAYMFVPDEEAGTITYISITASKDKEELARQQREDAGIESPDFVGLVRSYTLSAEEKAVWNEKQSFAHTENNNEFGHEIETLFLVKDNFGNRALAGVDISYDSVYQQINQFFAVMALIILLVLLAIYSAVFLIIKRRVSRPAQQISRGMQDFIRDGKRTSVKLDIGGADEYAMIAQSFNQMTREIDDYLQNIRELNNEQAQQNAELNIAAQIQKGFLPAENLTSAHYELNALMSPARNIGGDLYDYLPLDDHRVLLVIADVSGKGVSAALFMAVTLTLIHQFAKAGLSPAEILRRTNNTLTEKNVAMLFATAFVGIYDTQTKQLTYANAGHNRPYIVGKTVRMLDSSAGIMLGLFADEKYEEASVYMRTGDTLFLYTDGVNEIADPSQKFYGIPRLEEALNRFKADHGDHLISFIHREILDFANGAEPHDDITMLTLTAKDTREWLLHLDVRELPQIKTAILQLPMLPAQQRALCLAAEEYFVNICSYAFPGAIPANERVRFSVSISDRISVRFEDGGQPFDPLQNTDTPADYDPDTQIGGLGKFIAASNVDDIHYEYKDGKNILTLIKYF